MRFSVGIVQALPMTDPALAATADRAAPLRDGRLRGIDALWIALVFFLGQGAVIAASLVIGVVYGLITHRPLLGGEGLTADVTQAVIVVAMATAAAVFFFGSLWIARRRGIGMVELGFRRTEGRWYLLAAVLFVLFFLIDGFLFRWVDPSGALQEQLTSQLFLRTDSVLWMGVVRSPPGRSPPSPRKPSSGASSIAGSASGPPSSSPCWRAARFSGSRISIFSCRAEPPASC